MTTTQTPENLPSGLLRVITHPLWLDLPHLCTLVLKCHDCGQRVPWDLHSEECDSCLAPSLKDWIEYTELPDVSCWATDLPQKVVEEGPSLRLFAGFKEIWDNRPFTREEAASLATMDDYMEHQLHIQIYSPPPPPQPNPHLLPPPPQPDPGIINRTFWRMFFFHLFVALFTTAFLYENIEIREGVGSWHCEGEENAALYDEESKQLKCDSGRRESVSGETKVTLYFFSMAGLTFLFLIGRALYRRVRKGNSP